MGRGLKQSELNKLKTNCPRGHAYSEANTIHRPDGRGNMCRICRECARLYEEKRAARRGEETREGRGGADAFKVRG